MRLAFACFAFEFEFDAHGNWKRTNEAKRRAVFQVKQSGQYVYCDLSGLQHQGVMGRRQPYEDEWRAKDVWLLIDERVNDVFHSKISNVCVFTWSEENSYHKLLCKTNATRIVLSSWTKAELTAFLKCANKAQLRERMKPYLEFLDQEAARSDTKLSMMTGWISTGSTGLRNEMLVAFWPTMRWMRGLKSAARTKRWTRFWKIISNIDSISWAAASDRS